MDSLDKKLSHLPPQLRDEVEDFVDFLIMKHEKSTTKSDHAVKPELKKDQKVIRPEGEIPTPVASADPPTPPPIKRSMAFTRVELMGTPQYTEAITSKISPTNSPPNQKGTEIQKPVSSEPKKNVSELNAQEPKNLSNTTEEPKPKVEILGEREIETERQLFNCPFCKSVVQDNWDDCPFCNKPLKKTAEVPTPAKKKWFA